MKVRGGRMVPAGGADPQVAFAQTYQPKVRAMLADIAKMKADKNKSVWAVKAIDNAEVALRNLLGMIGGD